MDIKLSLVEDFKCELGVAHLWYANAGTLKEDMAMICPVCQSKNIKKNGHKRGKQNHYCKDCGRQFIDNYSPKGYPDYVKQHCLHLYVEGNGLRRIERLTGVCHNTVINWIKAAALSLTESPDYQEIPEVTQIDKLQTYMATQT